MAFILLGAPGSGKGTQAKNFVEKISCVHLSTGDLLRNEVAQGTDLGKEAQNLMQNGKYVPDEIVFSLLENKAKDLFNKEKVVFDGFPRTLPQVDLLKKLLDKFDIKLKKVFNINLGDEVIIDRAVQRIVCSECSAVYNKVTSPPKIKGVCDSCGAGLKVRTDDNEDAVRNRLKVYHETAGPIIDYYKSNDLLVEIDGALSSDKVWASVSSYL
jgi:adenylate kinase